MRGPRLPLEFLVHKHLATARSYGLHDRGVIAPSYRADLNVIDLANLGLEPPIIVHDLPAGGKRIVQRAGATGTPSSMERKSRSTAKTPAPGPTACFAGSGPAQAGER
jgi:N-acyl-D-aspartate/D-glutamate deacylase